MKIVLRKRNKAYPLLTHKGIFVAAALTLALAALAVWLSATPLLVQPYTPLTQGEIEAMQLRAPAVDADQQAIADAALSLVGKVRYFWGGKSSAIGWDQDWGLLKKVSSSGSASSGTVRPFGLDCSGYVSWCFYQLGLTEAEMRSRVGEGTLNQWQLSEQIAWKELQIGDLAFQNRYPGAKANHVGICVGFDEQGRPYFAHVSSSFNDVVITPAGRVFKHARRPLYYAKQKGSN